MSTPLTIELFNESTTLDLQVNELTIKSAINELFEVSLSCGVPVGDDLLAKLDNYADFTLSINGDFGNPKFELELQSYDINYQPNTDIQILELKLTDRYAKFRKLDHKGAFYYHNLNDIWLKFYDGFKDRLNRKISDNILFDSNNTNKYPTHPIYVQYNETHWNFLTRALLEHGVNYNFVAGQDGFNFVMYNTNEDITKFIQSDKSNSIDELYSYNLKLDANIKNKDDTVLAYNIIPAKSGYVANSDIKDFCNYHNKEKQRPTLRPKKFIKNINFIHHNPYTPESFLISKATLDSPIKMNITQDFKSRFNTLTQSQLDECLDTQKNVLSSLDAEQLICNISKVFLLAGAKLDISGNNKLESREHIVTSSLVKLSASTSTDKVIGATPKKNYNVITTLISQDIHIDYHQEAPEQPQISSLVGVFPYLAESSTNHDVVDPDDIGNVRVKLPLDYEVCPNNEKDIRYYVPRVSDYGDTNSSHSVQLYRESELLLMFIDGNPNKPIIYGALSHGKTSDQSMKDHHNRHIKEWGQGSGFGYSSDVKGTNDIFIKSQHNDGIAWVAQSNHGSKNELSLDQLFASTSNRSDTATGEYQHFYGYDDNTNFAANHHKSIKPKTAVEDIKTVKQETIKAVAPTQASTFTAYNLSKAELAKKQQEIAEEEKKKEECCPPLTDLPDKDAAILCELVYEQNLLNSLPKDKNLSSLIYDDESSLLSDKTKALLSKDEDKNSPTKGMLNMPLDDYASYYQPVLAKYKLVAVSSSNSVDYFGIAIAKECDTKNKGIYIINRGTATSENWITDTRMALQHLIPVNTLTFCTKAGVEFAESVINDNVEHVGFAGHSLGGSITQIQTLYFSSYDVNLSPSKTFEGYGVKGLIDNIGNFDCIRNSYGLNMVVSCPAELVHDVIKVPASVISIFTDSAMEKQVKDNYDKYKSSIDITNFIRRGDPVANYATPVGTPKYIDNDNSISSSINLGFEFHSITNFRYQGFNGETMSLTSCNEENIEILKTHKGVYTKEKFNAVFTELLHEKI
ncbi:hypothetical protein IBE48_05510 [Francisella philomiragia]|uniref:Phage late control D family protein n=2 Tax=Francisella philomiragia TaxID=28110 RepID=A0AAW3DET7_9GAMM|nr:hypothetical protein [Francisella philomiragia]KFJ43992.1 phage late control D family protein [Francisella philomiragia]MBK2277189.1 hypothetical protein [Francisella philomiragia]MBK2281108.1 hypothetical protein [Francisella philomiragia]MBK2292918.1 hypothetical protein [Francisella philomiragia]MBK2298501.1 hypothetical protein [Francisella philomiragia]